jgi:5-methylcytosine-specific restriction endonuclease McrA
MNKKAIRERFRAEVFGRDQHKCVICKEPAVDAHHIMDRSLWPDGGYLINNGVSLCAKDHKKAEENKFSTKHLRQMAGIMYVELPPGFDVTKKYDKWGNLL